ncbi:MAG: ATP synthase F0 subunit B [Desulfovibrionaceae bacterium]|nr:ATP synthase F0 subunit B [Deltaproteobacteria bacterium]MBR5734654.1 ATP synthase F0 subunit B [Desulfovibrionaceae bacterium]
MKPLLSFILSKDGIIVILTMIFLGIVSSLNTATPAVNFVARTANLLVFLYVLWRAGGRQLKDFFSSRRSGIAAELDTLQVQKQEAEQRLAKLEQQLDTIESEREAILQQSREQANLLKAEILARAEKEADAIREHAKIAAEKQAKAELAALRAEMADELARKVEQELRKTLSPSQHAAIIDNSLEKAVLQ